MAIKSYMKLVDEISAKNTRPFCVMFRKLCTSMKNLNLKDLLDRLTGLIASNPRENQTILVTGGNSIKNPWKHLPNTKNFYVSVNALDPLLMKYGIARKFSPELKFDPLSHRLKACNRYLDIQFAVLCNLLSKGQALKFWHRAFMLLQRSKVLRLVALRKLRTNWGRDMKFGLVKALLRQLDYKIQNLDIKINMVRTYVDKIKPDGTLTHRPIGSPSYVDRMYLYLLSTFFVIFLGNYIGPYQHAYRPGKGVVSAWLDLDSDKSRLSTWPNIYEFDLKGFFPSINISYCMWALREIGLPKDIAEFIFDMSLSYPDPTTLDESKLDETNALFKYELDTLGLLHLDVKPFVMKFVDSQGNYTGKVLQPIMEFIKLNGKDLLIELMIEDLGYSRREIENNWWACLYEYWQVQSALFESFAPAAKDSNPDASMFGGFFDLRRSQLNDPEFYNRDKYDHEPGFKAVLEPQIQGFPQGGALSPILSIFAFEYSLKRNYFDWMFRAKFPSFLERTVMKIVAYADDFILLCKEKFEESKLLCDTLALKAMGITFNKDKSGWIRKDGKWMVEKFKFLGNTYHTKYGLIEGTPRSGKDLMFDKGAMLQDFINRDLALREINDTCRWGLTPQTILDNWGQAESPYSLIPEEIITTGRKATSQELDNLLAATWDLATEQSTDSGLSFGALGQEIDLNNPKTKARALKAVTYGGYALTSKGGSVGWLSSPRLAGFLQSRLHSGTWLPINSVLPELDEEGFGKVWFENKLDRRFDPKDRSWAQLVAKSRSLPKRLLTMSNLSSYCTLSALQHLSKSGQGLKIKHSSIKTYGIFNHKN